MTQQVHGHAFDLEGLHCPNFCVSQRRAHATIVGLGRAKAQDPLLTLNVCYLCPVLKSGTFGRTFLRKTSILGSCRSIPE